MKKKISRYLTVIVLCFSCILLFKSGNIKAYETDLADGRGLETGYDRLVEEEREYHDKFGWSALRFYLGGESYIILDVALLVAVMVLVFMLVLEKVTGV